MRTSQRRAGDCSVAIDGGARIRAAELRAPSDFDAELDELRPQHLRGSEGGPARDVALEMAAVHDERRERRALVLVEGRLPAGADPDLVEEGLVADDRAGHACDPGVIHRAGEPADLRAGKRRVAVALQDQLAVPDRARLVALFAQLSRDRVARAEDRERRHGDRELLVRRRLQRDGGILSVDVRVLGEVEDDRPGLAARDALRAERAVEAALQGGGRRGGNGERDEGRRQNDKRTLPGDGSEASRG